MTSNLGSIFAYSPLHANSSDGWEEAKGYVSDGWGSGGSPSPYIVNPYQGITARGMQQERPVIVDGYFNK